MNDNEFAVLDELYFVTAYPDLKTKLNLTDKELCETLESLLGKGYIRILFPDQDTEHPYIETAFKTEYQEYFFLATKAGLVVHNSI
ncbi:hypothetical protein [Pontibacter arcticus]|uniref:Uncharacterized protein n=1 Tax=Pontibacter arcticus TaxID=2080288 RepID=A0A364RGK9_9BACT|nr:hypothetical protein [Pontibacter arcticus]RAU83397.1 hypothetical protein DP923_09365 [Pontibacter arcticus]